jgi:hypothetical protein
MVLQWDAVAAVIYFCSFRLFTPYYVASLEKVSKNRRWNLTCNFFTNSNWRASMPRGNKSSYTSEQKRMAEHIEQGYEKRGIRGSEADRRAWATVNKETGGGKKQSPARKKSSSSRTTKTSSSTSRTSSRKTGSSMTRGRKGTTRRGTTSSRKK